MHHPTGWGKPHSKTLTIEQLRGMPLHAGRVALAAEGWFSDIKMDSRGSRHGATAGVWISRWDWHGVSCDRQSFHDFTGPGFGQAELREIFLYAAELALRAYRDHPNEIVRQSGDGDLKVDQHMTSLVFTGNRRTVAPTECLPDPAIVAATAPSLVECPIMAARLALLADGVETEDSITCSGFGFDNGSREDRQWGYELKLRIDHWHGAFIPPQSINYSADYLKPAIVLATLRGAAEGVAALRQAYPAGGPMPPLFLTWDDMNRHDEEKKRRQEDETLRQAPELRPLILRKRLDRLMADQDLVKLFHGDIDKLRTALSDPEPGDEVEEEPDQDPSP